VPSYEPRGPYGAKEVGEGASVPVLGSIANAIYDAVGVRITELPITPEKVLKAIRAKRGEDGGQERSQRCRRSPRGVGPGVKARASGG